MNDKQNQLNDILTEMLTINALLKQLKQTTHTLEHLKNSGLLSPQAHHDIYHQQVAPALNDIRRQQDILLDTYSTLKKRIFLGNKLH